MLIETVQVTPNDLSSLQLNKHNFTETFIKNLYGHIY